MGSEESGFILNMCGLNNKKSVMLEFEMTRCPSKERIFTIIKIL